MSMLYRRTTNGSINRNSLYHSNYLLSLSNGWSDGYQSRKKKIRQTEEKKMSSNDLTTSELEQLISSITFFQLGARVKEMRTIKIKLKNQLKEKQNESGNQEIY